LQLHFPALYEPKEARNRTFGGPYVVSRGFRAACLTPRSDDNPKSKRCAKAVDKLNDSSASLTAVGRLRHAAPDDFAGRVA